MTKNKKRKFYRKEKRKEEPEKLPKNSRFITEKVFSDHLIFLIGITCILLAILVVSLNIYSNYRMQIELSSQKAKMATNLVFWQKEVKERPNYRDGYFSLALIYYQLKDYKKSSKYLDKAMNIDPNFEKGKELQAILDTN